MPSGDLVTQVYGDFRGVDFRGEEINLVRSPDSLNMWKDYKETESIRTRPDMEMIVKSSVDTIYGIFFYTVGDTDMMIIHAGGRLYKIIGDKTAKSPQEKFLDRPIEVLYGGVNHARSNAFVYNNSWYFKDGIKYLQYDGTKIGEIRDNWYGSALPLYDPYIPTTSISRSPAGGGKIHEDVNLLSERRKNTFCADGISQTYYLDAQDLDYGGCVATVNGVEVTAVAVNVKEGTVTFPTPPPKPLTDGQDNVVITFKKTIAGNADRINKCTLLQVFDNRVFFSGNPEYPNMIWHCSLNDPTYCSDLDYYNEGLDSADVKGLVAGNNVLWVFKEPSQANTTVFYHTPTIDSEYGKIYPSSHSSISTGCIGGAINFNDDIVFFSNRGMEGINGDITTEQVIAHRSSLVDRKLTAEPNYQNMILEEWDGYLVVIIDNKVYLADSRAVFTNENHYEYEWFYWELDKNITCAKVNDGVLYLGTEDGVYTLTDHKGNVESYWVTPKDKFRHPQYAKTTNKRGCVVESKGDISVSVKTDKTEFEHIGDYNGVTDAFVCRIKRKKFKDIQLKFHSNTRFTLETATLECFIGGYLKR